MNDNETKGKLFATILFAGKNVVVPGAGRGIGAAIASGVINCQYIL